MRNYDYDERNYEKNKSNTGLVVAVSVLSTFLAVVIIAVLLFVTGVFSPASTENDDMTVVSDTETTQASANAPVVMEKQPIKVEKSMYIGNCRVSVTLRTGPGTQYGEICQVPIGDEVYVIEYTTDDFAMVTYNGNRGYIKRDYIVTVKPKVWYYNDNEVADFVENSLYGFVHGVNTGDEDYVYEYFAGSAAEEELRSRKQIDEAVLTEEILSVSCHSVNRASASQVTCVRDSVIRVTYNDGKVKDIPERYKYTVDLSSGRMYIVAIEKM